MNTEQAKAFHPAFRNALPLVASREEGRAIAERWLHESRISRDGARFALPPSQSHLGPGDVVEVGGATWRIDRVEDAGARAVEAVRVEAGTWRPAADAPADPVAPRPVAVPVPVEAVFLDLPLLTGDEAPEAPHVTFVAEPWPGPVSLRSSDVDADYAQVLAAPRPATIGTTLTPLRRAEPGVWDRGPALRVRLARGALSSAGMDRVLGGAGAAAIGDGVSDHWEVFQFAEAELRAPGIWDLRLRLRGQAGTDGVMPDELPAGARVVLLDGVPAQWGYPASHWDRLRHYRWGLAGRPVSDPSWRHREIAFRGIGLRPYAVCHLRARRSGGDLSVTWVRRTRIDGDSWTGVEVPLGEEREAYVLRLLRDGEVLREAEVGSPSWTYTAAMRAEDGPGPVAIEVAQLSDRFGPGPVQSIETMD